MCLCLCEHTHGSPQRLTVTEGWCSRKRLQSALNVSQSDLGPWSRANLTIVSTHTYTHTLIVVHSCYEKHLNVFQPNPTGGTHTLKVTAPSLLFTSASSSSEATSTSERSVQTKRLCWSGIRSGGWRWWQRWSPRWWREPRFRIWPQSWWSLTFFINVTFCDFTFGRKIQQHKDISLSFANTPPEI